MKSSLLTLSLALFSCFQMQADNGHGLWLGTPLPDNSCQVFIPNNSSQTLQIASKELYSSWKGGNIQLKFNAEIDNPEAYRIVIQQNNVTIAGSTDVALLYGSYALLRLQNSRLNVQDTIVNESPYFNLRILNHWDNPDGSVERGYAGASIFWAKDIKNRRDLIQDYGRANASIGINATVIDNVNANICMLTTEYLLRVRDFADWLRPYGVHVWLSVKFSSPIAVGGLQTADPLDPEVAEWWKDKCQEIYELIPDFGGFLIKANSEGQPGPNDYNRSHAEGANVLARALAPFGGRVMWRAFVYAPNDPDRAKQAYQEFMPLDGQFEPNVIIQIKNGPIDFQCREPYSPLFGAMQYTQEAVEFQITQEYLGHSHHIVYLAPMWEEFYGYANPASMTAAAGVSNIGDSDCWCGNVMAQSNWYAFGRQSWNPVLSSEEILNEWIAQTFPQLPSGNSSIFDMLIGSREACTDYMMPMGLHHLAGDGHYGPGPWFWNPRVRADWQPPYYHKAAADGLGFDRSSNGTDAVSQYPDDFAKIMDDVDTCPEEFLLWFHHVAWDHIIQGETLWNRLCHHYQHGVDEVAKMQQMWADVATYIDAEIHAQITEKLDIQYHDAIWWKDACLEHFRTFNGNLPYPDDVMPAVNSLEDMKRGRMRLGLWGAPTKDQLDGVRK